MPNAQDRELLSLEIAPQLVVTLQERFGRAGATFCILGCDHLDSSVYRLRFESDGTPHSVVVKRLEQAIARRVEVVARRWLPAVRLAHAGPPLLTAADDPDGQHVWHVYEDLGGCVLDERAPDRKGVTATIELIGQLHVRFAGHALIGECRQLCGDAGMAFYGNSVRDAMRSVAGFEERDSRLTAGRLTVRDRILAHLSRLLDEEPRRARVMAEFAGPDTLLHGDLWPKNTVVFSSESGTRVRFIDWDRVKVGPVSYDLSAFVSRLPDGGRAWIVEQYRQAVGHAGWHLPDSATLKVLFSTAESARLANCTIWPALAATQGEAAWEWAFERLAALDEWLTALREHGVRM
jgi:Phosphotransferase enzyme family